MCKYKMKPIKITKISRKINKLKKKIIRSALVSRETYRWSTSASPVTSSTQDASTTASTFVKSIKSSSVSWVGMLVWMPLRLHQSRFRWWRKTRKSCRKRLSLSIRRRCSLASLFSISMMISLYLRRNPKNKKSVRISIKLKLILCKFMRKLASPDDVMIHVSNSGLSNKLDKDSLINNEIWIDYESM
jgi:hypothetical protein